MGDLKNKTGGVLGGVVKIEPHFSPLPPSRKPTIEASSYYLAALAQLVEHLICNQ